MADEAKTLLDDLSAAWDAADEPETPETPETTDEQESGAAAEPPAPGDTPAPGDEPGRADLQRPADEPDAVPADSPAAAAEPAGDGGDAGGPAVDDPPRGWNAEERESWKDVPEKARAAIARREQDFSDGIAQYARNAQRAQQMDQVLAPYAQYLGMNGNPGQTIQTLLQTGSILQMGTPQQRAQVTMDIINQFGVDLDMLSGMLTGKATQQPQQDVQSVVRQELAQYRQYEEQQRQQEAIQTADSEVTRFSQDKRNEFYDDVKNDMADLLEISAMRGQPLSLEQAYQRACDMNPQVRQVLAARAATNAVPAKVAAAASVSGSPGGTEAREVPDTLRGAIEDAWANTGRV